MVIPPNSEMTNDRQESASRVCRAIEAGVIRVEPGGKYIEPDRTVSVNIIIENKKVLRVVQMVLVISFESEATAALEGS